MGSRGMSDPTLKAAQKLLGKDPRFAYRELSTTCPRRVTPAKTRKLQRGVSEIAGIVENLKMEYARLKKEISADQDGIDDYEGAKGLLVRKVEDCELRLTKNRKTIKLFSDSIGPLEAQYESLQKDSKLKFEDAKKFYDKAIQMLIDKFDYNPAFKRPGDQL